MVQSNKMLNICIYIQKILNRLALVEEGDSSSLTSPLHTEKNLLPLPFGPLRSPELSRMVVIHPSSSLWLEAGSDT